VERLRPAWVPIHVVRTRSEKYQKLELRALTGEYGSSPPGAVHHQITHQLLTQAIRGDSLWASIPDGRESRPLHVEQGLGARIPLYLASENLPAPVRALWDGRNDISVISSDDWHRQDPRAAGMLLQVGPTMTLGPFAWVDLTRTVRTERSPDEGPRGWASGVQFTLLRTDDGWQVIEVGGWVT
jgi:hypothetical protein